MQRQQQQQSSNGVNAFEGNYNDSIYCIKRDVERECQRAIPQQLSPARSEDGEILYALEWYELEDENRKSSSIVACGIGSYDGLAKYMVVDCAPGLFVCSWQLNTLRCMVHLYGYQLIVFDNLNDFRTNNCTVFDFIANVEQVAEARDANRERLSVLCKIVTPTFTQARELHKILRNQDVDRAKEYAAIPFYWDVYRLVLYELFTRNCVAAGTLSDTKNLKSVRVWIDKSLIIHPEFDFDEDDNCDMVAATNHQHEQRQILDRERLRDYTRITFITFDVETSSSDPYRVPTGEDVDDHLVTCAIYHEHTDTMYSLVYLPFDPRNLNADKSVLTRTPPPKGSPGAKRYNVVTELYFTEVDILTRTMQLLNLPDRYHYLVGYNSANYDIKYLMTRCAFYNLPVLDRFIYKSCFVYGANQIHLDLFRIAMMMYTLPDYKLGTLAQRLLHTSKEDVNAVDIRFTFALMQRIGRVPDDDPEIGISVLRRENWPTIRDIIDYNEKDTLLVYDIVQLAHIEEYVNQYAYNSGISLCSINENYKRIKYPLMCLCEKNLLGERMMITQFKDTRRILAVPTIRQQSQPVYDYRYIEYDANTMLGCKMLNNKNRYPGGVNYCYGAVMVDDVVEYDYEQAYLSVIINLNLSDETCAVIRASLLFELLAPLFDRGSCNNNNNNNDDNVEDLLNAQFQTFDYKTHSGENAIETRVIIHQYIYENMECGSEFRLCRDELAKRGDGAVIVVARAQKRCGVLSRAVQLLVDERARIKESRNRLTTALESIDVEHKNLIMEQLEAQQYAVNDESDVEKDTNNDDDDDDEEYTNVDIKNDADKSSTNGNDDEDDDYPGSPTVNDDDDDYPGSPTTNDHSNSSSPTKRYNDKDDDDEYPGLPHDDDNEYPGSPHDDDNEYPGSPHDDDNEYPSSPHDNVDNGSLTCADENDYDDDDNYPGSPTASENYPGSPKCDNFDVETENQGSDKKRRKTDNDHAIAINNTNNNSSTTGTVKRQRFYFEDCVARFDENGRLKLTFDKVTALKKLSSKSRKQQQQQQQHQSTLPGIFSSSAYKSNDEETVTRTSTTTTTLSSLETEAESYWSIKRRIEFLKELKEKIEIDITNYTNRYSHLKTITLSVYGIVGSLNTELAAIITAIPRMTLIQQAKMLADRGLPIYYLDTDCLHTSNTNDDESKCLNSAFPYLKLEQKFLNRVIYQKRKTYYRYDNGVIKYGANNNGPPSWRYMIEYFDRGCRNLRYIDEIRDLCRQFFLDVYDRVYDECVESGSYEQGFAFVTRNIKLSTYKPTMIYRDYLRTHYPEMATTIRQTVYLYLDPKNVTNLVYRPFTQLSSNSDTVLERDYVFAPSTTNPTNGNSIEAAAATTTTTTITTNNTNNETEFKRKLAIRLLSVNLYKYFYPVFSTCFNIVFAYCRENYKDRHISMHPLNFYIMILHGYLSAMRSRMKKWQCYEVKRVNATTNTAISTETIVESQLQRDDDDVEENQQQQFETLQNVCVNLENELLTDEKFFE
ncbi:DNApol B [Phenacoccus solenopsis nudivirus]|nr:DNApol B [Phenacoccus solenopsis nudivirus]